MCFYTFFARSLLRAPFENLQKKHLNGLFERVVQQIALGAFFFQAYKRQKMIPERSESRLGAIEGALRRKRKKQRKLTKTIGFYRVWAPSEGPSWGEVAILSPLSALLKPFKTSSHRLVVLLALSLIHI